MDFHTLLYQAQKNNAKDKEVSNGLCNVQRVFYKQEHMVGRKYIIGYLIS